MRKFRFVGHPDNYSRWEKLPIFNMVFDEKTHAEYYGSGALEAWKVLENMPDWQEVFEEPIKTLHKDTDLGYFAGLVLPSVYQSWGTGHDQRVIDESISLAYQLIKELDQENK